MRRSVLVAVVVILACTSLGADENQARVLLQAAEAQATVQGDLKGAIATYERALAEAGANRSLAARALVRMAECYQKLGNTEARKIAERLIRDYADQKEAVADARLVLGSTTTAVDNSIVSRQAWTFSTVDVFGDVSPDGRYVPYIDYDVGLMLHDLTTGTNRRVTDNKDGEVSASLTGAYTFSRDGKRLAYSWGNFRTSRQELRVISLQEPGIPTFRTLVNSEEIRQIMAHDWSPDGRWIAVAIGRTDHTAQIGLLSTTDGSLRVLKTIDWRFPSHIYFSPDGRYLAFDVQGDVFILAVDASREIPAVVHPGKDLLAGWSPDGSRLLFTSDRAGSTSLWSVRFLNGAVQGPPDLIKRDLGDATTTVGVTASGALYSVVYAGKTQGNRSQDILQAAFDFSAGKFVSPPAPAVQTYVGTNRQPQYSRDGKYLAYLSRDFMLCIRSLDTDEVREVSLAEQMAYVLSFTWSADGSSFIVVGTDAKGRSGIFRVDGKTHRTTMLMQPESDNRNDVNGARESGDGKFLYHRLVAPRTDILTPPDHVSIVRRDLQSGTTTELVRRSNIAPYFIVSPDGRYIAAGSIDTATKSSSIFVVPTEGGEARDLFRDRQIRNQLMWAPDSQSLLIGKGTEVWRAPIDGTPMTRVDATFDPSWGPLVPHPDGRRVAIQTSSPAKGAELWVLEHFLPSGSPKK